MGLLDEAIREHLDLRRRHGVDPAVVAREEVDALTPVEREESPGHRDASAETFAEDNGRPGAEAGRSAGPPSAAIFDGRLVTDDTTGGGRENARPDAASFMEATAEIDMRAVLGELEHAMSGQEAGGEARVRRAVRTENATPVAAGSARSAFDVERDEDPLSWETAAPRVRRVEPSDDERATNGQLLP